MKKFIKSLLIALLAALMLVGCGTSNNKVDTTTSGEDNANTPAVYDENAEITIEYDGETATGEGSAELTVSKAYSTSKTIKITIPETQHYLAVTIAKDVLEESIVYLKNSVLTYKIPDFTRSYPTEMRQKGCIISARIPTVSELTATHNIALNTCDLTTAKNTYPHAVTSNTNSADAEWMARNIIDGFVQNNGHGTYPLQSWGPNDNVTKKDYIKIDFGHDVSVEQLVLYIRADFPHDGYWDSCTIQFSDGTTQDITMTNSPRAQKITIDGGKVTSSLTFTNFNKAAASTGVWCAWIELQVNGSEIMD